MRSFDSLLMASFPLVRFGSSKAQAGLAKIITVISTIAPRHVPLDLQRDAFIDGGGNSKAAVSRVQDAGFGIDLSLRFDPLPEANGGPPAGLVDPIAPLDSSDISTVEKGSEKDLAVEDSISPAESAAGEISTTEKSSEGECDLVKVREEVQKEVEEEGSGITNIPRKTKRDEDVMKEDEAREGADAEAHGSEGYLGLLLEAARQISGDLYDDESGKERLEPSPSHLPPPAAVAEDSGERRNGARAVRSKRKRMCWTPFDFYEDSAPVVRSKRGRNQALPSRYRDSVLEPWRKPPTVTRSGRTANP